MLSRPPKAAKARSEEKLSAPHVITPRLEGAARLTRHYRLGPFLYLGAFAASFISEAASVSFCLLLAFFFALQGWPSDSRD